MDIFLILVALVVGFAFGQLRSRAKLAVLQAKYDRLTDRDERGRFVKRS